VLSGIGDGFWWSGVTFTGVGYGDKVPVTIAGRLVALVWMLVSVICVSALTATVTAKLSLGHMSEIRSHQSLGGHVVGALEGTASESYLRHQHIRTKLFPTITGALQAVATGQVDAFVHDFATLKYLSHSRSDLTVLPEIVENENYAFVLANGSPLREQINVAMLAITEQPMWRDIKLRYLAD
jgi:ABC-type amino acid transport substrate-binding protein